MPAFASRFSPRSPILVCLLLLVGTLGGSGCRYPENRPNIVLICFDTLRADHLPIYGYERDTSPELDRYFADAEVFDHAYSTASFTTASIVSMLSGLLPARHGVRDFYQRLPGEITLLPDELSSMGYQTAAIVSNTVLTDEALGMADRFDYYDDFVDERELNRSVYERRASRTTDAAIRWLNLERDPRRPHFLLLHYIDPHAPYLPPESESPRRFQHEGSLAFSSLPPSYQRLPGVTDALTYVDRYDEEIAYADREMGRFLAAYAKHGLLDDAVLVFTADHGETLLEHRPHFAHSSAIWSEVLRVPLLIRWPGGTASRNPTPVSLVDLAPTILHAIDPDRRFEFDGVPFSERQAGDLLLQENWKDSRAQAKAIRKRAVIRGHEKWTFQLLPDGRIEPLWHSDLSSDPLEAKPGPWRGQSAETRKRIEAVISAELARDPAPMSAQKGKRLSGPKPAPALEEHQREALEALGYIE